MKYKKKSGTVPPPIKTDNRGAKRNPESFLAKLRNLKVNESLTITDKDIRSVSASASTVSKQTKNAYACRTVDGKVTVWRTA